MIANHFFFLFLQRRTIRLGSEHPVSEPETLPLVVYGRRAARGLGRSLCALWLPSSTGPKKHRDVHDAAARQSERTDCVCCGEDMPQAAHGSSSKPA